MKWITNFVGLTTIAMLLTTMPVRSQSFNPETVEKLAKQYTVRIRSSAADPGSGFIIGRNRNRYTVLTAAHVIGELNVKSDYSCIFLGTYDSQKYAVKLQTVHLLPENDLAVLEFESSRDYPVATLSNYQYPVRDKRNYQQQSGQLSQMGNRFDHLSINQSYRNEFAAFTIGYPNLTKGNDIENCQTAPSAQDLGTFDLKTSAGKLIDTSGTAITNPDARYRNYAMVYTNMTYVGMSGGPVVDPNGRVIGIHGRSDGKELDESMRTVIKDYIPEGGEKLVNRFRLGMSLGVPMQTVIKLMPRLQLNSSLFSISNQAPNTPDMNQFGWLGTNDFQQGPNYETNPLYWLETGNQQWRINQLDQAQKSFDRALDLDRQQRGALQHYGYFMKGFAYAQAQSHEKALENCIKATEMVQGKEFYDAWRCQASEYAYLKQFPQATAALNKAIDLRKSTIGKDKIENPSDYVILAELLSGQGEHAKALEKLEIAIDLRKSQDLEDSATVRNLRATILMKTKRYDEALTECDRAIALDKTYATPWTLKGLILNEQGQQEASIAAYRQATIVNPNDSNSWDSLGVALYGSGQGKEALVAFEKAVRLDPNNTNAKANWEDLRKELKP
jgi:tetratricopeptide (TPR) repeat protein